MFSPTGLLPETHIIGSIILKDTLGIFINLFPSHYYFYFMANINTHFIIFFPLFFLSLDASFEVPEIYKGDTTLVVTSSPSKHSLFFLNAIKPSSYSIIRNLGCVHRISIRPDLGNVGLDLF